MTNEFPEKLLCFDGATEVCKSVFRSTLLDSELDRILQTREMNDYAGILAAAWFVERLALPGVWPQQSLMPVVSSAVVRLRPIMSDPDKRDILTGDPELWRTADHIFSRLVKRSKGQF